MLLKKKKFLLFIYKSEILLSIYKDVCDKQKFISKSEESFIQRDVENNELKEENKKLRKENRNEKLETRNEKVETRNEKREMTNENEQFKENNIIKGANIKKEPKEIKSPNWINKNKFKNILAIIDSNKFNYKNKIGEFKYTDIKDLVNNIKNNTISEIDAKKI